MKSPKPTGAYLGVALAWALATACGGVEPAEESPKPTSPPAGTIGVALELGPSSVLYAATYTLTGPDSFVRSVTVSIGDTLRLATLIGSVPPGSGYVVSVSGTASDGVSICAGTSEPFDVVAGLTTTVSLRLECREPARTGNVLVDGLANFCPVVDLLSVSATEVAVGEVVSLGGTARDANNAPSPISFLWTATAGIIEEPMVQSTTFVCTEVGESTIELTVSDGDCTDKGSLEVTCVAPARSP